MTKFLIARVFRSTLVQLETRLVQKGIHILTSRAVPPFVQFFLNKGGKFIVDSNEWSYPAIRKNLFDLQRSLNIKCFFDCKEPRPRASLLQKCSLKSKWEPPENQDVKRYIQATLNEIHEVKRRSKLSNIGRLDRLALRWIRDHPELCIVDCDKNVGDAIVDRDFAHHECNRLLTEGFQQISDDTYRTAAQCAKHAIDSLFFEAAEKNVVPKPVYKFVVHRFRDSSPGEFRLRLKLHKTPVVGRPIGNLTQSFLQPLAVFVNEGLTPIMKACQDVVESSYHFMKAVRGTVIPEGFTVLTSDVRNLYPMIPNSGGDDMSPRALLPVLSRRIRSWYRDRPSFGTLLISSIECLIRGQHISFQKVVYKNKSGIITGLACACTMANIYMSELDEFVRENFSDNIVFFKRLIDDAIYCIDKAQAPRFQTLLGSFHENIQWEHDDVEKEHVTFLDLELSIEQTGDERRLCWKMHRKPQSIYQYIPLSSGHPPSMFSSFVQGELQRIHMTNLVENDRAKHRNFFVKRLAERGYPRNWIASQLRKHHLKHKPATTRVFSPSAPANKPVFIRMIFDRSLNPKQVTGLLNKHRHKLPFNCSIRIAWCCQRSIFRRLYSLNWRR